MYRWDAETDADTRVELGLDQQFATQADAEAWLSASWEDLAEAGLDAVTLYEGDRVIYGPMGLTAG